MVKEEEFKISLHDKMSRFSKWILISIIISIILFGLFLWIQWSSAIGGPESVAIAISIVALIVSSAEFYRSHISETRQGDIIALHGLRNFLSYLDLKEVTNTHSLMQDIYRCFSEIDEAIPSTSSRFRRNLYWLTVQIRDIRSEEITKYLILRREQIESDRIPEGGEIEDFPGINPTVLRVKGFLKKCRLMVKRMEYVYFGRTITPGL